MRRVYGYKRRDHACGKRYQDGINAQATADKDVVINATALVVPDAPGGEEIELKPAAGVAKVPAIPQSTERLTESSVKPAPVVVKVEEKEEDDDIGDLPKHMTGFMDVLPQTETEKKAQAKVFGAEDEAIDTE